MCSLVVNGRFTGEMRVCQGAEIFFRFVGWHGPGPLAPGPWGLGGSSGPLHGLVGGVRILGEDLVGSNGGFK